MSELLLITLLLCGILTLLAYKMRSQPVALVAGLGWVTAGGLAFEELASPLPLLLCIMIGTCQVFTVRA